MLFAPCPVGRFIDHQLDTGAEFINCQQCKMPVTMVHRSIHINEKQSIKGEELSAFLK